MIHYANMGESVPQMTPITRIASAPLATWADGVNMLAKVNREAPPNGLGVD